MQKSNTIWVIISDFLVASFSRRSRLPVVSLPRGLRVPFTPWGHWMPWGEVVIGRWKSVCV